MARHPDLQLPNGWTRLEGDRAGPFVTVERALDEHGVVHEWRSRVQRLRAGRIDRSVGSTWWAPGAVVWWIAVFFTIGSACFAVGATPGYIDLVGASADATTFFVGSIFFTSAALLEYLQMANTDRGPVVAGERRRIRLLSFEPHRSAWWAVTVQLAGTLLFNYSTFHALDLSLDPQGINRVVWFPDWLGSICFLVASGFALIELGRGWFSWRPRDQGWWVANLNMGGSIAFGVSAVASRIVMPTGDVRSQELTNLGTFVGAICFGVAAVLLLPERAAALVVDGARSGPGTEPGPGAP